MSKYEYSRDDEWGNIYRKKDGQSHFEEFVPDTNKWFKWKADQFKAIGEHDPFGPLSGEHYDHIPESEAKDLIDRMVSYCKDHEAPINWNSVL